LAALLTGIPLGYTLWTNGPEKVVIACAVVRDPRERIDIQFEDGSRLSIPSTEFESKCPPVGTHVEKRRWELGYRFDGAYQPMRAAFGVLVFAIVLGVLVVDIIVRLRRKTASRVR